jgi:hypothetical protein
MDRLVCVSATAVLSLIAIVAFAQENRPTIGDAPQIRAGRGIGYSTVAAALEALRARSDVDISVQDGWTIVNDRSAGTLWSFTPPSHPAHPAAAKRVVVEKNGSVSIEMSGLCEAEKAACDKLMAEFREMNDKIRASIRSKAQPGAAADRPQAGSR